ncbi:MAG TPA: hypothetical protein EYG94_05905 [Campylobacterales bacterium]|nr:hypothetical protein [Campylobacterales bacterium]
MLGDFEVFLLGIMVFLFIPFSFFFRKKKNILFTYVWFLTIILIYMFFDGLYDGWRRPMGRMSGAVAVLAVLFAPFLIVPLFVVTVTEKMYKLLWRRYLLPLLVIFLIANILFQGFIIFSAYKAHTIATEMKAYIVKEESMWDFYSPTVNHIKIYAGNPSNHHRYRWSYHRMKYVID